MYVRGRQGHAGASLYTALSQWETGPALVSNPTKASDWSTYEPYASAAAARLSRRAVRFRTIFSAPRRCDRSVRDRAAQDAAHPNGGAGKYNYAYNDGDGTTYYDVEYRFRSTASIRTSTRRYDLQPESFNDMRTSTSC